MENESVGTVFATDTILATLMCSPRSVYSWDIVIQKVGNKLFLDKRDASFDLLTVSYYFNSFLIELGNVLFEALKDLQLEDVKVRFIGRPVKYVHDGSNVPPTYRFTRLHKSLFLKRKIASIRFTL